MGDNHSFQNKRHIFYTERFEIHSERLQAIQNDLKIIQNVLYQNCIPLPVRTSDTHKKRVFYLVKFSEKIVKIIIVYFNKRMT